MAKIHLDRLSKRGYAPGTVRAGKYRALVRKIMAENTKMIHNRVGEIARKDWDKQKEKLHPRVKRILRLPSVDEVLPARSIQTIKSAQQGNLITDTLRDDITRKIRAKVSEYTEKPSVKIDKDLIRRFEKGLRGVFRGYTKRDPKIGMPTNIHTIAVTEIRTSINNIKNSYADKVQQRNPDLVVRKRWIHNNSLSHEPRPGHLALNGKTIPITEKFVVKTYAKRKGRWMQTGTVQMAHPHDTSAPPGETIGCVVQGTEVIPYGIEKVYKRKYSGKIVSIKTHSGFQFRVTPNHPILTEKGFISANLIEKGNRIISVCFDNIRWRFDMNIQNRPSVIDKIFYFFSIVFLKKRVATTETDFHGDGKSGNVDVVSIDGKLLNTLNSFFCHPIKYFFFTFPYIKKRFLFTYRTFVYLLISHFCSLPRFICVFCQRLFFGKSHFFIPKDRSRRIISNSNFFSDKSFPNSSPIDIHHFCNRVFGDTTTIKFDDVIDIKSFNFCGHVYNLQTKDGIYLIYHNSTNKSIVSHNCSCDTVYITVKAK